MPKEQRRPFNLILQNPDLSILNQDFRYVCVKMGAYSPALPHISEPAYKRMTREQPALPFLAVMAEMLEG